MTLSPITDKSPLTARPSAIVIAFPARTRNTAPDPHARLARALDSLQFALGNQRAAIAAWRDVLKDLKSTTAHLDESLQRYRASLRSLGSSVSALQTKARDLENWAEKASHTEN